MANTNRVVFLWKTKWKGFRCSLHVSVPLPQRGAAQQRVCWSRCTGACRIWCHRNDAWASAVAPTASRQWAEGTGRGGKTISGQRIESAHFFSYSQVGEEMWAVTTCAQDTNVTHQATQGPGESRHDKWVQISKSTHPGERWSTSPCESWCQHLRCFHLFTLQLFVPPVASGWLISKSFWTA